MLQLLTTEITRIVPSDAGNKHFLRVCLNCLNMLQQIFPTAKERLVSLVEELFGKIKSIVEDKSLVDIMKKNLSRQLFVNLITKYNIFLSSVNVNLLTRIDKVIGNNLSFFEAACKWTISNFSQNFSTSLAYNDELTVE